MRLIFGLALAAVVTVAWFLPGCTTDQEASNVLCQPSQLVRCNSCPQTGKCAGESCRGWLQCSTDGTSFVGTCSECEPDDTDADSCVSLQTCCTQSSLPTSEQSTCNSVVQSNDEDNCYTLLDQYLSAHSCGGVSNPVPPSEGGITGSCATLAPCCAASGHSAQAAGACSALVTMDNESACADATNFYCGTSDGGCNDGSSGCGDSMPPDGPLDEAMSDVILSEDGGDAEPTDSGLCGDSDFFCDAPFD
jgi:hypothetical protein